MHPFQHIPIYEMGQELIAAPATNLAWKIVEEFYDTFGIDGAEEGIWSAVTFAMLADNESLDHDQRNSILFYYENFRILNKALFHLFQQYCK